jgi:CubicO group peptidase (beta-lactamase class C family)
MQKFVPALAKDKSKGGYSDKSLDRVLRMRSGVKWREYSRWRRTDGDKFEHCVKVGQKETIVQFAQGYSPARKEAFNYSGLDANIIGVVAQSLLGSKPPWQSYETVLWKYIGAKEEARLKIDKEGTGIGACCFYLRIYDLARFGLFVLRKGRNGDGNQVIPDAWFDLATRLQSGINDAIPDGNDSHNEKCPLGAFNYRYQWWLLPKRTDFTAVGIDGQFVHIYPDANALIVQISDWSNWTNGDYLECETFALHDALIDALR